MKRIINPKSEGNLYVWIFEIILLGFHGEIAVIGQTKCETRIWSFIIVTLGPVHLGFVCHESYYHLPFIIYNDTQIECHHLKKLPEFSRRFFCCRAEQSQTKIG